MERRGKWSKIIFRIGSCSSYGGSGNAEKTGEYTGTASEYYYDPNGNLISEVKSMTAKQDIIDPAGSMFGFELTQNNGGVTSYKGDGFVYDAFDNQTKTNTSHLQNRRPE